MGEVKPIFFHFCDNLSASKTQKRNSEVAWIHPLSVWGMEKIKGRESCHGTNVSAFDWWSDRNNERERMRDRERERERTKGLECDGTVKDKKTEWDRVMKKIGDNRIKQHLGAKKGRESNWQMVKSQCTVEVQREEGERRREINLAA